MRFKVGDIIKDANVIDSVHYKVITYEEYKKITGRIDSFYGVENKVFFFQVIQSKVPIAFFSIDENFYELVKRREGFLKRRKLP